MIFRIRSRVTSDALLGMANKQMLARAPLRGSRLLEWIEPDQGLSASSFADLEAAADGYPLRIGTEKLLRVASALRSFGFRAVELHLVNSKLLPLVDSERDVEVQDVALSLLRDSTADEVVSYFRNAARDAHVIGVVLGLDGGGGRMTLRRNGWVTVQDTAITSLVKDSLQQTIEDVGLV